MNETRVLVGMERTGVFLPFRTGVRFNNRPPSPCFKIGGSCNCKKVCFEQVNEPSQQSISSSYYMLESDDAQHAYLFGLIRPKAVKLRYGVAADGAGSRRQQTIKYFIRVNSQELHF